ncbi:membrane protein, partial (plasmid) [Borreliella bissettiae]
MNKIMKIFIICVVLVLIISCKNYASDKDEKSLEQNLKEKVEGFLDTKKEELFGGFEKPEAKVKPKAEELVQADEPQGQGEDQVVQGVVEDSESKENGIDKNDQELQEEIKKEIKELKDKIDKADPKNISIRTYSGYEKKIKELKGKLEEKLKDE